MEDEKFERKLKKLKLNNANFKDMPIQIQDEIIASWERIFDSEFENKYYTHKKDKKMIHACCWDINESEIVKIDKFKAR
jgi:hypothetical protein